MNFFDDITKLEAKEDPKEEAKEGPKEGQKQEPEGDPKEEPKEEPKENNSYTELQAQITELKDMFKKFIEVNKGEENNDN